ncbi:2-amino-4-hydroxy-6-hydroxymethyldihydropteridine diphosphokinase [Actinomyces sp. W5033]|uniref:2-amino-4-hydroxy-6- hydroxymethyldihydropteridine diphosphokinase n=1 Tax=Actinomyces sp. W5033 TaxID=3446479 RepID=UPI003EE39F3C
MSTSSTPVDRIRLSGLSARGYHGVLDSEREEGQLFVADVVLGLGARGTSVAAASDCLDDAVDYAEVASAVVAVLEGEPVNLIETLAARVVDVVLGFTGVQEVEVTIHKPQAPVPVAFEDVTVTITRTVRDVVARAEGRSDADAHLPAWTADAGACAAPPELAVEPAVALAVEDLTAGQPVSEPVVEPAGGPLADGGWAEEAGASVDEAAAGTVEQAGEPVVAPAPDAAQDLAPGDAALSPVPDPVEAQSDLASGLEAAPGLETAAGLGAGTVLGAGAGLGAVEAAAGLGAAPLGAGAADALGAAEAEAGQAAPAGFCVPVQPAESVAPLPPEPVTAPAAQPAPPAAVSAQSPVEAPAAVDPLDLRPQTPAQVVLALGANVGKVVPTLRTAVRTLSSMEGLTVTTVAPLARTTAVTLPGAQPQPDYLNTVLLATTTMTPRELLEVCQDLEAAAGRVRTAPWGPRTLDIDLISFEGVTSDDPVLALPHPRAAERAFVLVPWSTADPFAELSGHSVAALAEAAPDREGLRWLALDWLDSDRLPTLPTGQYVVPPTDDQLPDPEEAPVPEAPAAAPQAPAAPQVPAEPVSWEEAPAAAAQALSEPAAHPEPEIQPDPFAQPEPVSWEEAPAAQPEPGIPAEPVLPPAAAPEDGWAAPMGWDDVIGGNRS